MDVARLGGGGGAAQGAAAPAAEGAGAVGGQAVSGLRHPDLVQGLRRLPLPPPGPGPRPGLVAPTGAPAAQVMSHGRGPRLLGAPLWVFYPTELHRAQRTEESKPEIL